MVKIKIEAADKWLEAVLEEIAEKFCGPTTLNELGAKTLRLIQNRIRAGYGVSDMGQPKQALKPLEASTIKTRQSLARNSKLSSKTSPSKSNLTQSGAMVDDISYRIEGTKIVFFYKTAASAAKAGYVSEVRPHLYLSAEEWSAFQEELANILAKIK